MTLRAYKNIHPVLGPGAYVDDTALVCGDVQIGADSSIWPMTVARGDVNIIRIGERTNIQDTSVLHVTHRRGDLPDGWPLLIGNEVTVGHRVTLHGCTVHDHCLIGMDSTVMDGAILHSSTLLGAGSLVTEGKELEGGYLWAGRPARRIRALTDEERNYIRYLAGHYVRLKENYHAG